METGAGARRGRMTDEVKYGSGNGKLGNSSPDYLVVTVVLDRSLICPSDRRPLNPIPGVTD